MSNTTFKEAPATGPGTASPGPGAAAAGSGKAPGSATAAGPATTTAAGGGPPRDDAATVAFRNFLAARRRCNSLPDDARSRDPARFAVAWRAYDRADIAMRHAPIATPRGARAALSYLVIGLESLDPGPWSAPVFRNVMRFLRRLPVEAGADAFPPPA